MNYFTVFKNVLMKPSEFFKKMPRDDDLTHALFFSFVFLLITVLIGDFFDSIYVGEYIMLPGPVFITELFSIFVVYIFFSIGLIISFNVLGYKENYRNTFKIIAYSTAVFPFQFLPIFPKMGILASIYWMHVCIRGGQYVHNLSYWKSCFIVLLGLTVIPLMLLSIIIEIIYLPIFDI